MKLRSALLVTALTLGLGGCASYPMYSQVGVGYYDDDYYGGYGGYYGYGGYGGYPYPGWSAMYPFGGYGYCPARYGYCPPYGFGAYMDPFYYGFGIFMPYGYGYGGWYGQYWNGYPYYGHGHSHDHDHDHDHDQDQDQDHDDDHDDGDRPPTDGGQVPPGPRPAPWRRGSDRPLPKPDPMADDGGLDQGMGTDLDDVAPAPGLPGQVTRPVNRAGQPYRPAPTGYQSYPRPPPATPPPGGSRPQPSRRELPAPEPRPRAQDPSNDSDQAEPKRGGGKRPSRSGTDN